MYKPCIINYRLTIWKHLTTHGFFWGFPEMDPSSLDFRCQRVHPKKNGRWNGETPLFLGNPHLRSSEKRPHVNWPQPLFLGGLESTALWGRTSILLSDLSWWVITKPCNDITSICQLFLYSLRHEGLFHRNMSIIILRQSLIFLVAVSIFNYQMTI